MVNGRGATSNLIPFSTCRWQPKRRQENNVNCYFHWICLRDSGKNSENEIIFSEKKMVQTRQKKANDAVILKLEKQHFKREKMGLFSKIHTHKQTHDG